MANIHVLVSRNNRAAVVFHIPVPTVGTNKAGATWAVALKNSKLGGTTVLSDGDGTGGTISAAEKGLIIDGSLHEVQEELPLESAGTDAQMVAYLDQRYQAAVTAVRSHLQETLKYFGYSR